MRNRTLRGAVRLAALAVMGCALPASAVELAVPAAGREAGTHSPAAIADTRPSGLPAAFAIPSLSASAAAPLSISAAPSAHAPAVSIAVFAPALVPAAAATTSNEDFVGPESASGLSPDSIKTAPIADAAQRSSDRRFRTVRFALATARALFPWSRSAPRIGPDSGEATALAAAPLELAAAIDGPERVARSVERAAVPAPSAGSTRGKRAFMAGTFVYNLATSVMLVVQQALFFTLAQQDQLHRGVSAASADLHAAGVVFGLATLVGAMRIPGNSLGAWLSTKTDQRNLSALSSVGRAAILASVAGLVVFHQITLPLAAALYAADWLIGGLEEVSRNTQTLALVKSGTSEFKSWSTLSQFLAQLTGLFGPLFVIVLAQFKGLGMAGHVVAPLLFVAAAGLYAFIPKDAFHRASDAGAEAKSSRLEKWRAFARDRGLLLPVLALALLSTLLLKGPLSLNMASLLLHKSGTALVTYSALLSGLFGAGLGVGSWLAHAQDESKPWSLTPARWLAVGGLATAALAVSWAFGALPMLALPAIASAWFLFALANAAGQALMMHRLQDRVAAAGPDKKYVVGLSLTLSNAVITGLRVLAGVIFLAAAASWQVGFGLFGGLMLLVALGQWLLSRAMTKGDSHVG